MIFFDVKEEEMPHTRRLTLYMLALLAAALLASCGGAPAAELPTAAPEPTAKPTLTPRPSPKPQPTAEPTAEPTASTGTPQLIDVEIGDLKTYTHDNELFSVDVPAGWTFKDHSKPTEAIASWTDQAENAFMQVDIFEQEKKDTKQDLANFLKDYLQQTFGSQPDFSQDAAEESGPSMLIVWTYTGEGTGGVKAKLLGNSFIKQIGNKISLFTIVVPQEQFDRLQPSLDKILGSYTINDKVSLIGGGSGAQPADVEIGDLETYKYESGLFSIDAPKNWTLQDNSKAGEAILLWNEPKGNGLIAVDLFEQKAKQSSDELTALLKNFLTKTFGNEEGFALNEPKAQADGSVLLVWTYVHKTRGDLKVLGNSFIEQREDKVSILSTVVPDAQFDRLLPETNKIIQSYSIDPSAALP